MIAINKAFVILAMLFCHIADDYYLQGCLANLKQKSWWEKNAPDEKYRYDYIMALIMHAASWAFMIMLPLAFYMSFEINTQFIVVFVLNAIIHGRVDNMKANKREINLIQDQIWHICQIAATAVIFLT